MNSIAIASGKGGTGKTTMAVSLYHVLSKTLKDQVKIVDCDVEEPNDKIFFQNATEASTEEIFKQVPFISTDACTYCRKCVEYCEFNAIVVLPSAEFAEVNADLCHSCGACLVACQDNAITERPESIGHINTFNLNRGGGLVEGRLKIGSAMQTMLIRELKKRYNHKKELVIFDAPPGTSCPVVETISDVDFVVLVAEPTPFGLHDLSLMLELLSEIKKPHGVVINKSGIGNKEIYTYLREKDVSILGEIPFSIPLAETYSAGNLLDNIPDDIHKEFENIANTLRSKTGV